MKRKDASDINISPPTTEYKTKEYHTKPYKTKPANSTRLGIIRDR